MIVFMNVALLIFLLRSIGYLGVMVDWGETYMGSIG